MQTDKRLLTIIYIKQTYSHYNNYKCRLEVDSLREEVACVGVDPDGGGAGVRGPGAGLAHRAHLPAEVITRGYILSIIASKSGYIFYISSI